MFFSYVKSKLLYPNLTRTSPSIFFNARANTSKNPIIRKITTTSSYLNHSNFGRVPAHNRMFARTFITMKSETLTDLWCPRKTALQLKSIMTKFRKTSCVALAMCLFLRVECVPFSGRRHLVIRSPKHITIFRTPTVTDIMLECVPFKYEKVLPSTHEKTLRFATIARKVGQGMHDVLGVEQDFKVMAYGPAVDTESNPGFTVGQQTSYNKTPKRWLINNKGFIRGYSTRNLEGREWKVSVIDSPEDNACIAFGHISICTALLDKASDQEVAFVIGHEMGHAVGEHLMEDIIWYLPKTIIIATAIIISTLSAGYNYQRNDKICDFVKNRRHRRQEHEADHIGMMLMASAGYDPQAALMCMSKYFSSYDYSPSCRGTHPNGCDRITYLKSQERMNEAMNLYKDVTSSLIIDELIWNFGLKSPTKETRLIKL